MKLKLLSLIFSLFFAGFCFAQNQILVLNSQTKTVNILNANDGSIVNTNFINLSSLSAGTIKGIAQVNNRIWITDQTKNLIYVYDFGGTLISTIPSSVGLSNIRGLNVVNNEVWVTSAGSTNGSVNNSIRRLDFSGNSVGVYPTIGSPFDVLNVGNSTALVTSFNTEGIQKLGYDGTVIGNLVGSGVFNGIEQINLTSNGNLVLGTFSNGGNPAGLYVISSANGSILNSWPVTAGLRGAIQVSNGQYLYSTGGGVYRLDPATGTSTQILSGSYQYFTMLNGVLAVDEIKEKKTRVFPNPTEGISYFESKEKIKSINIYSTSGQLLRVIENVNAYKTSVDFSGMSKNVYILQVVLEKSTENLKMIKK